jgi:hypothetical protein
MIVLDVNAFPSVFDKDSSDNNEFFYVLRWVTNQEHACFVYGGTKYKNELRKMEKYFKIMTELKKAGKFIEISAQLIDADAIRLKSICLDAAFNDEHIVAILNISGCKLVCTKDIEAMPYIKRKDFYSDQKIPQIYTSARNKDLLNVTYIIALKNMC